MTTALRGEERGMPPQMHKQTIDLTGRTFGQLLVMAYAGRRKRNTYWTCKCLGCGSVRDYSGSNLHRGLSTACNRCPAKQRKQRERNYKRPGYRAWKRISKTRDVCARWLSFAEFIADMGEPPEGKLFLIRIDPGKPYQPGNCVWSAAAKVRFLTHEGRTMSILDWARALGWSDSGLRFRLKTMPLSEALTNRGSGLDL